MTLRHQSGFTISELFIASFIISLLAFTGFKLSLEILGEDGHDIARAATMMLDKDIDTTAEVRFLLAPSARIATKSLDDSRKLITLTFSTEKGCTDTLGLMTRPNQAFSVQSINAGWLTFDPNTLPIKERIFHLITVCQHSLETKQSAEMTVLLSS